MYTTLNEHYKARFGCKVYKLSLDAGLTCPNRDGTLGTRGCIFCSNCGSGEFAEKNNGSVKEQLSNAKKRVASKSKNAKFIAYFQSFTNTYAPVSKLKMLYLDAMENDDIVGLAVATRPDCIAEDVLGLLKEINEHKPVYVELGLQTIHQKSVEYIRRGYTNDVYFDAVHRLKKAKINVVTHIIIGLPGETDEMIVETTRQAVLAGTDGIKFHLLYVLRGTDLEKEYLAGKFRCLELEEYGRILKKCVDVLPQNVVVHRLTGDGVKKDLIAPLWSADKKRVLNYLRELLNK